MTDRNSTIQSTPKQAKNARLTTREFIRRAKLKQGDRYSYEQTVYINRRTSVIITCKAHGDFEQRPDLHLRGHACGKCANYDATLGANEFVLRAKEVHGEAKHCYKKINYKKLHAEVCIGCKHHGYFKVVARNYLRGKSCPECAADGTGYSRGYFKQACDRNKKGIGILYIIECSSDTENFYKIGITSRGVADRFGNKDKMPYAFNVVAEVTGEAEYIYNLEGEIHSMQRSFCYKPNTFFHGQSECFSDISAEVKSLLRLE